MLCYDSSLTLHMQWIELPPGANTSDPNIYVAIEQTGSFQTSSATSFGPTAVEDFPTDLNWVPLSSVYNQSLLIDNNQLVISGTNSNQFDGYFRLYLCTTATPNPPVSGSASLLILLLVGGSMSGGWYVSKQKKGSVAYRVIRVGVFALIVVVVLVGCSGDPTGTPEPSGTPGPTSTSEPIPQPTSCPEAPGIPTVTPAPPTAIPSPTLIVTDTPTIAPSPTYGATPTPPPPPPPGNCPITTIGTGANIRRGPNNDDLIVEGLNNTKNQTFNAQNWACS